MPHYMPLLAMYRIDLTQAPSDSSSSPLLPEVSLDAAPSVTVDEGGTHSTYRYIDPHVVAECSKAINNCSLYALLIIALETVAWEPFC